MRNEDNEKAKEMYVLGGGDPDDGEFEWFLRTMKDVVRGPCRIASTGVDGTRY